MFNATVGGLIKDYRLKKRLSQQEVSLQIGWRDTSRLSKIEQGRVSKPTRETIEKVIKALGLSEQERGGFLLAGGYLPTDAEVEKVIKEIESKVRNWPYPAVCTDFSWRCLLVNQACIETFGFPKDFIDLVPQIKPNLLELVIAPKELLPVEIFKGDSEGNLKPFAIAQTVQFKYEQAGRESDAWYKKLIGKLLENQQFRKIWVNNNEKTYHKKLLDYEYKIIRWPDNKKPEQRYHVFSSRLISDQRFQLVLYLSA